VIGVKYIPTNIFVLIRTAGAMCSKHKYT